MCVFKPIDDAFRFHLSASSLSFITFVDPSWIPLHLIQGSSLNVSSTNEQTMQWLNDVLINEAPLRNGSIFPYYEGSIFEPWHLTDLEQSRIGILARPSSSLPAASDGLARVTEILFYAERRDYTETAKPPTPPYASGINVQARKESHIAATDASSIAIRALPLSSEHLFTSISSSELPIQPGEAKFVSSTSAKREAEQQQSRKRLSDLFDEASDRTKKARHGSSHNISIAASRATSTPRSPQVPTVDGQVIKQEPQDYPTFDNSSQRCEDSKSHQPRRQQVDSSRSFNAETNPRPPSRLDQPDRHRSSLSKAGTTSSLQEDSYESRNKQTVSRTVMAGMRLYGLQQRKTQMLSEQHSRESLRSPDGFGDEHDHRDIEYKSVYHQTYKGTLFAFVSSLVVSVPLVIYLLRRLIFTAI